MCAVKYGLNRNSGVNQIIHLLISLLEDIIEVRETNAQYHSTQPSAFIPEVKSA